VGAPVREARFAGSWYPGERAELEEFFAQNVPSAKPEPAIAVMAPHAGFVYSGKIAGETYARVQVPETAVVLCPNHRVPPPVLAVWAKGEWRTPLGAIPVDEALAAALSKEFRGLRADTFPHEKEHAVELQLPFLQHAQRDLRVVPIVVGIDRREEIREFGEALARAVRAHDRRVLLVASSDMNHYESAAIAERKDRLALERVLALEPDALLDTVDEHDISMCGVRPTAVVLHAARALGAKRARLVRHGHSGETSGDTSSVVGYAGVTID
jgi:AmmeMemoRadiSam system protein B